MTRLLFTVLFTAAVFSAQAQYKLYADGLEKYNQKDYLGAVELLSDFLTRPVRDKKFDVDAHYWRGLASFKLNDFEASVEDLQEALKLKHPNQGNIHWFMAKGHHALSHYPQAIESYDAALALFAKDNVRKAQLMSDRARSHQAAGQTDLARADLQNSLKLQPGIAEVEKQLRELDGVPAPVTSPASVALKQSAPEEKKDLPSKEKTEPAPAPTADSKPVADESRGIHTAGVGLQQTPTVAPSVPAEPTLEELYSGEKRFALVIGNSAYSQKIGVLRNPVNDATAFASTLKAMDFEVTLITDATYGKIRVEMLKFREKLNTGDKEHTVGLFYYAGHGLQHDNENYIVPVDAELEFEDDIPRYCFPIQKMVLNQLENTNSRMNILVLDACRNNPFPSMNRSIGGNQGLGEMRKARGAFIAYATSPGSVASDGTGSNGLYTQELIKAMQRPGRTIEQVFKDVRANVLRISEDRQNPWENSNIIGDFYFKLK